MKLFITITLSLFSFTTLASNCEDKISMIIAHEGKPIEITGDHEIGALSLVYHNLTFITYTNDDKCTTRITMTTTGETCDYRVLMIMKKYGQPESLIYHSTTKRTYVKYSNLLVTIQTKSGVSCAVTEELVYN